MFAGTYTAPDPMGMFQMLLDANGCLSGSRVAGPPPVPPPPLPPLPPPLLVEVASLLVLDG
jgi:hypothetical protein